MSGSTGVVLATGVGQASGVGALVVLALVVACVLLFRSLNTQLKRVPRSFGRTPPAQRPGASRLTATPDPAGDAARGGSGEARGGSGEDSGGSGAARGGSGEGGTGPADRSG